MTRRQTKWLVLFFLLVGVSAGAFFGVDYYYNKKDILTVQMGEALRQDLTQSVASTGEIKPKKSVNISSNAMGRIIRMPVKEGDRVKEGELLISLESIQTAADVEAAQAMLAAGQTELDAMESQIRSNDAAVVTAVCGSSSISSFARSFQSTRGETPLRSLFQALPFGP